mmetsp:Transcript_107594/g.213755  ORF Transcript_107594/g.213755 Transcript_107594/m.213755 type:complete len:202 (-) Transcript_107594:129-734(-)
MAVTALGRPRCIARRGRSWRFFWRGCHSSAAFHLPRRPKLAHEILGVSQSASTEEIKAAFRQQALRCHPDVVPGAAGSARLADDAEFRALRDAYAQMLGKNCRAKEDFDMPHNSHPHARDAGFKLTLGAIVLGVPLGMVLPDALYGRGVLKSMLAESVILKNGGWACNVCTCVNEAGTEVCRNCAEKRPHLKPQHGDLYGR